LQDKKVARLSAELDAVRREIAGLAMPLQRAAQRLTVIEQQISAESDPVRKKQLEQERAELRAMSAQVVDPQLLARESELANSLRNDRATLDELTEKLAVMERMLDIALPMSKKP
jgi:chromosome segregation ATPase